MPLSNQMYKLALASLMLGLASHPCRAEILLAFWASGLECRFKFSFSGKTLLKAVPCF